MLNTSLVEKKPLLWLFVGVCINSIASRLLYFKPIPFRDLFSTKMVAFLEKESILMSLVNLIVLQEAILVLF